MSEHENRWPGPGLGADAGDEDQRTDGRNLSAASSAPDGQPAASPAHEGQSTVATLPSTDVDAGGAVAPATPAAPAAGESRRSARATSGRRLNPVVIWSVVAAVVLVAAAITAYLVLRDDSEAPAPAPTTTVTLPAPTPTAQAVARGEGTALFAAFPDSVRQYVLTAITPADLAAEGGALEAYDLSYAGVADGVEATYTVHVAQWATPEEAAAAAEAWGSPLAPASSTGEVMVGGTASGAFSLFGDDGTATETGTAVWTNGTVVLQATGPALDIRNFYLAFSL